MQSDSDDKQNKQQQTSKELQTQNSKTSNKKTASKQMNQTMKSLIFQNVSQSSQIYNNTTINGIDQSCMSQMKRDFTELQKKCHLLQCENNVLQQQLNIAKQFKYENTQLMQSKKVLSEQLESMQNKNNQFTKQEHKLKKDNQGTIDQLQAQIREIQREKDALNSVLDATQQRLQKQEEENKGLLYGINDKKHKLQQAEQNMQQLQQRETHLQSTVQENAKMLAQQEQMQKEMETEVQKLKHKKLSSEECFKNIEAGWVLKQNIIEKEKHGLQCEVRQARHEADQMKQQASELVVDKAKVDFQLCNLKQDFNALQDDFQKAESSRQQCRSEAEKWKTDLMVLQSEFSSYKMLNQQHTELNKKNETDLLFFMEENQDLKLQAESNRNIITHLQNELQKLQSESQTLQEKYNNLEEIHLNQRLDLEKVQNQKDEISSQLAKQQQLNTKYKSQVNDLVKSNENAKLCQSTNNILEQKSAELTRENSHLSLTLNQQQAKITELLTDLKKEQLCSHEQSTEVQILRQKCTALQMQTAQLEQLQPQVYSQCEENGRLKVASQQMAMEYERLESEQKAIINLFEREKKLCEELQRENMSLHIESKNQKDSLNAALLRIERKKMKKIICNEQMAGMQNELDEAQEQIQSMMQQIQFQDQRNISLQNELACSQQESIKKNKENEDLQIVIQNAKRKQEELLENLRSKDIECQQQLTQIIQKNSEINRLTMLEQKVHASLTEAESHIKLQMHEIKQLQQQFNQKCSQNQSESEQTNMLSLNNNRLSKQIEELVQMKGELQSQILVYQDTQSRLNACVSRLEQEQAKSQSSLQTKLAEVEQLGMKIAYLDANNANLKQAMHSVEQDRDQNKELLEKLHLEQKTLYKTSLDNNTSMLQLAAAQEQLRQANRTIAELNDQNEQLFIQVKDQTKQAIQKQEQINQKQNEEQAQHERINFLEQENKHLQALVNIQERDLDRLNGLQNYRNKIARDIPAKTSSQGGKIQKQKNFIASQEREYQAISNINVNSAEKNMTAGLVLSGRQHQIINQQELLYKQYLQNKQAQTPLLLEDKQSGNATQKHYSPLKIDDN